MYQKTYIFRRFLSLSSTSMRVEILIIRPPLMNRGAGHGLKIPGKYRFLGYRKAVDWVARKITEEEAKLVHWLNKCLKNAL